MIKRKVLNEKGGFKAVFIVVFVLLLGTIIGFAQENKVDLNTLVQETQKMSQDISSMTFVWWIPEEYWKVSFEQDPSMTAAQTEDFLKVLRSYTIVVVVVGKVGSFGGITYKPVEDIRGSIQLIDKQGNSYLPISEDKINADTQNFLSMMKPVFANMLGSMGQNMHFFIFPDKGKNDQRIADATKEGSFKVKLGEEEFKWRLPLGALLPPQLCPTCKEKLTGSYKFCPWDGTKLP